MKKAYAWAPLLALGIIVAGCGGTDTTGLGGNKNPRIRAVADYQDVTATSADVAGTDLLTSQAFGSVSGYSIVNNGNRTITFNNVSGASSIPLANETDLLEENMFYTAIGTGSGPTGRQIILLTDGQDVVTNETKVRIVNADEDQAGIDVYFTSTATGSLTGQTPQIVNLAYADDAPAYLQLTPGSYKIWITPTGTTTVLKTQTVTLDPSTVITDVFAKTSSGTTIQTLHDRPLPSGTP